MNSIENPDTFRQNIRSKLCAIIGEESKSVNLEKGIYNFAIKEANQHKIIKKWNNKKFTQLYIDRLRAIFINLKNNPTLLEQIKNNEVKSHMVAFMTHQEMNPEHWRVLIEQKIKRDVSKFTNNIEASTDMFTCKKCRSKKCTYYELQTRSADEPATIFVTCLDCGKHWKS
jgi:transcription elongation factor S-II